MLMDHVRVVAGMNRQEVLEHLAEIAEVRYVWAQLEAEGVQTSADDVREANVRTYALLVQREALRQRGEVLRRRAALRGL
jgi:hypothetical protein